MAGRNRVIIVSSNPQGKFDEGKISGSGLKPGQAVQIKASSGIGDDGRFTWEAYNRDADGDRGHWYVLLPDRFNGDRLHTTEYTDGDRVWVYRPIAGEELNMLKGDVSGTADDFAVGDYLMLDDGTGKLVLTTGTPETESFLCLEAITDPTADVLVHVRYTGY